MQTGDSNRISFLPFSQEVDEYYFEWFNNPDVRKYLYKTTPSSRQDIRDWVKYTIISDSNKYFSIIFKGRNIGHVGLKKIDRKKSAEVTIIIGDPNLWDKGIGTKAVEFIVLYATQDLELDYLYAELIDVRNIGSVKLFTNLGFSETKRNDDYINVLRETEDK